MASEPGQCSLHDPATWQNDEAHLIDQLLDDLDAHVEVVLQPGDKLALRLAITPITPQLGQTGKAFMYGVKEELGAGCVAYVSCLNDDLQEMATRINQDVALAPVYLFPRRNALSAGLRLLHTLAADNRSARLEIAFQAKTRFSRTSSLILVKVPS